MSSLFHAKSVEVHLENFMDEALDLGLVSLSEELQSASDQLRTVIQQAEDWFQKRENEKEAMKLMDQKLLFYLGQSTMEMAFVLSERDYAALLTGRNLSVATRLAYRLRVLQKIAPQTPSLADFCRSHAQILREYDEKVDAYLGAAALLSHFQQEALWRSQQIRPILYRAKLSLLKSCQVGSEQYKRIRKRVVRTKKTLRLERNEFKYASTEASGG